MSAESPALLGAWRRSLPVRWRCLVVPYGRTMGVFVSGYAGATALLRPWPLGGWWNGGVPLAAGLGVCWWLWRPWATLATNSKGESRRLPLLLVWLLCLGLGLSLRAGLYYQLGQVRDLASVRELAQPGTAVFFRLHGPFYAARALRGHYESFSIRRERNGPRRFYSTCYLACPLLATAADTARHQAAPLAWLSYRYEEHLGDNLAPAEREWQRTNFVARCEAGFDTLDLTSFTYLERPENPEEGANQAVYAARRPTYPDPPLLLEPVQTPFAQRGRQPLGIALRLLLGGSALVVGLLLVMPLRPAEGPAVA
jgi:hypothetical protein